MGVIDLGVSENGISFVHSSFNKSLNITLEEEITFELVLLALADLAVDDASIHAERRSDNYLSIVAFEHHDFMRIKIGTHAKWFTVSLSPSDRADLADDKRFAKVKNKNQLHWKVALSSVDQLKEHFDLIQKAYLGAKWSHENFCSR